MPKERFARSLHLRVKPDRVNEFLKLMKRNVAQGVAREKGLRRRYLLKSHNDPSEYISLTFWNSSKDAESYEKTGRYDMYLNKIKDLLESTPTLYKYDVEGHIVGVSVAVKPLRKPRKRGKR